MGLLTRQGDPSMPPRLAAMDRTWAVGDHWCTIYFARKRLVARNIAVEIGSQFPFQAKDMIRGLGPSFGIPAEVADKMPFHELDYVGGLAVPVRVYEEIRRRPDMKYQDCVEFVRQRTGVAA
jgi:hypothetical protein